MLHELLGDGSSLSQSRRAMDLQALLVVTFVIPLNVAITVWSLWRAHVGFDTQAEQEATQGRWKVAS
jgi:hypothetical protein